MNRGLFEERTSRWQRPRGGLAYRALLLAALAAALQRADGVDFRALPRDAQDSRAPARDKPPGAELDRAGESVWHLRAKRETSPPPRSLDFRPAPGTLHAAPVHNASHPRLLQVTFWGGTATGSCGAGVTLPLAGTGTVSCSASGSLPQTCECMCARRHAVELYTVLLCMELQV